MVNVAILGFGTVGSGVAEVIYKNNSHISQKVANQVNLKYILDIRDFPDSILPISLFMISLRSRTIPKWTWWWRPLAAPQSPWSIPAVP